MSNRRRRPSIQSQESPEKEGSEHQVNIENPQSQNKSRQTGRRGTEEVDQDHEDADDIDFDVFKKRDFMRQKQSNLLPNKKLKDFYQKYNEENEVSVFTMAENMAHLQETDLYQSPVKYTDKVFEAHPIYKKVLAEKLEREEEEAATQQKSNDMVKTM